MECMKQMELYIPCHVRAAGLMFVRWYGPNSVLVALCETHLKEELAKLELSQGTSVRT